MGFTFYDRDQATVMACSNCKKMISIIVPAYSPIGKTIIACDICKQEHCIELYVVNGKLYYSLLQLEAESQDIATKEAVKEETQSDEIKLPRF